MSVKRQAGKVWIEGVPALGEPGLPVPWLARSSQTCTFAGALEAALSLTERPYSYEQILALSGMAFRTRWFDGEDGPTGCPCAPVGETPDVKRRFAAATGWHFEADLVSAAYDDRGTYIGSFEDLGACMGGSGYEDTDASQWTPGMRLRERQTLEQCLGLERSAVEAMHKALPQMTLPNAA